MSRATARRRARRLLFGVGVGFASGAMFGIVATPLLIGVAPQSGVGATVPAFVVRSGADVSGDRSIGEPRSIAIPSIGVDADLVGVGYRPDGGVDVPDDPATPGWFTPGPRPGERGPAVIMGHVDSRSAGPGAFYRLRDLVPGDRAIVETSDGPVEFVVTSVEQHAKDEFPTEAVYGPVPSAALRLITCGGSFDRDVRSYRDNVVAFLVPIS